MSALLEFDSEGHRYFQNGREVFGVTEILRRAGKISEFAQRSEEKRWIGDSVHKITAGADRSGHLDLRRVPADLKGYVKAWENYKRASGYTTFPYIEHRVDSFTYGYAGTLDRANMDVLFELFAGSGVPEYKRWQLAGYGNALDPHHAFRRVVICLAKDESYRVKEYLLADYLKDRNEFLRMRAKVGNGVYLPAGV